MIPPKPASRRRRVSLWQYWRLFQQDILSAQPEHLFRAKMAEFRTPFFRSFLVNEPSLVRKVLQDDGNVFPKSDRVTRGLRLLLGQSVFVTNGEIWKRQRRIIDPSFEKGRVRRSFPAMLDAAKDAVGRVKPGLIDVEELASHATADVIFRTLFSIPIDDKSAAETYGAFRAFQKTQPVAVMSALIPWLPTRHPKDAQTAAIRLRELIDAAVSTRKNAIEAGTAPDDLATRIMTTVDPETGETFSADEMADQVAIFFLAGHETSAALLGWALWCLAAAPEWAEKVALEGQGFVVDPRFENLSKLSFTRNVLRETLRLYPPVPMMVREAKQKTVFRNRTVRQGAQIVLSPWHLGRHESHWKNPDEFDPSRWETEEGKAAARNAFIPFSSGPRVCTGAAFAMAESAVLLAALMSAFDFETDATPTPVAHLTLRSKDGIKLRVRKRQNPIGFDSV